MKIISFTSSPRFNKTSWEHTLQKLNQGLQLLFPLTQYIILFVKSGLWVYPVRWIQLPNKSQDRENKLHLINFFSNFKSRGTWVAQWVKASAFSSGHDPRVLESSPTSGSLLSREPASPFLAAYLWSLCQIKSLKKYTRSKTHKIILSKYVLTTMYKLYSHFML